MVPDPKACGAWFRDARRRLDITQAELAEYLGTSQSAVSLFEAGQAHTLSAEKITRGGEWLGIDVATGQVVATASRVERCAKYCVRDVCPSNVPYAVGRELVFWPALTEGLAGRAERCRLCQAELRAGCPNPSCGAPVVRQAAFCPTCGSPYVPVVSPFAADAEAWADRQRARIRDLRELTGLNG